MKLSIIIPVYNNEFKLFRCLESIENQLFQDWECIIIDDGSKDRSYEVAETFSIKDNRFKAIRKFNQGPSVARNIGLYLARGEWISFCDSDDWIEPNKYTLMLSIAEEKNVNIVQCGINVYNENNELKKYWKLGENGEEGFYTVSDKRILTTATYDIGHCWDKIYKRDILKDIYFPEGMHMCEDTIFNLKAFLKYGKIYSLQTPLHNYTENSDSLAHKSLTKTEVRNLKNHVNTQISEMKSLDNYSLYEDIINKFFNDIFNRYDFIDYVFPYVDSSKSIWQKSYKDATNQSIDLERFSSHEELLKYKFRAMAKWAPWISNVYILVSDEEQIPEWLNKNTVNVVLHKDFIPKEFLPTFNSCTIEMFLQNIPNLEEKFIYGNDDVYFNDIVKPKFFYPEKDKITMDLRERKLYHEGDINKVWAQIPQNSLKLAARDKSEYLNKYIDGIHLYELPHVDKPMLKSNNEYVYSIYKNEIESSISQLRSVNNLNQSLFTEYLMFHDRALWEMYRFGYFQVGNDTNRIVEALSTKDKRPREICCNDSDRATEKDYQRILSEFKRLYPEKCKYEV